MPQSLALLEPKGLPSPLGPVPHPPGAGPDEGFKLFGKDGLTFDDVLDTINPLHHLPVVGFIYRALTGDTISPASRISGGALFGGPFGLAASVADTVLKEASGRDAGGHLLSLVQGENSEELLPQLKPDAEPDSEWEQMAGLRHDANEFEDWRPLAATSEAAAGATAKAAAEPRQNFAAASLRYDDDGTEGTDDEPAPVTRKAAATTSPAAAALAAQGVPTRPDAGPIKARPSATNSPLADAAGPRPAPQAAAASPFPSARALAANPSMVTALRKGESPYFRPGGNLNSDTWLKLMNNAGANRKDGTPPTGAGGLSSATIAKALAKYGAAAGNPAVAPAK